MKVIGRHFYYIFLARFARLKFYKSNVFYTRVDAKFGLGILKLVREKSGNFVV